MDAPAYPMEVKHSMKAFLSLILMVMVAVPVFAREDSVTIKVFNNMSTTGNSTAYNTIGFRHKSMSVQGIAVSGHTAASLSGTVAAQCAPTASGPWQTCAGITGTAISTTSNGNFYWIDPFPFTRAAFTKTSGEVSVYFSFGN